MKVKSESEVTLRDPMAAFQALPSMGFSRQEYWSGVPLPSPVEGFRKDKNLKNSRDLVAVIRLLLVAVNRLFIESISTRNVSVSTVFIQEESI